MEEPVEYNAGKKEERILITTRHTNKELNMTFTSMYKEFTRQEAIEKMSKAMYAEIWKSKNPLIRVQNWKVGVNEQTKNKYRKQAEASLDALLGDDK